MADGIGAYLWEAGACRQSRFAEEPLLKLVRTPWMGTASVAGVDGIGWIAIDTDGYGLTAAVR
jgi:hypothetical protein